MQVRTEALLLLLLLAILPARVMAQQSSSNVMPLDFDIDSFLDANQLGNSESLADFVWVRGRYTNYPNGGRGMRRRGGWWDTDYPDAESNFLRGVQRYTNIDTHSKSYEWMDLTDPRLYEHTFLYMNMKRVPIGTLYSGPNFNPEEIEALREFMFRGGFVMVDDFWGEEHWQDFLLEIAKLFPERELVRLDTQHEIFHTFFDVNEVAQVPGRMVTWDGGVFNLDDPAYPPSVHAILDDDGRVMFVANFNTDLGDGWEHTFYERYPTHYTNEAYKLTINYLIYAFTH
ncbi:MAG: DUF4159 domain-containing protein [Pseudomonadales bacterium]|nr:DUF4159 domain-containing protein [Pseudomonadales bacterium]